MSSSGLIPQLTNFHDAIVELKLKKFSLVLFEKSNKLINNFQTLWTKNALSSHAQLSFYFQKQKQLLQKIGFKLLHYSMHRFALLQSIQQQQSCGPEPIRVSQLTPKTPVPDHPICVSHLCPNGSTKQGGVMDNASSNYRLQETGYVKCLHIQCLLSWVCALQSHA